MSYVPPHARNRKEPQPVTKDVKIVDAEFPTFVPSRKPINTFTGASFLSKITETSRLEPIPASKEITIPTTRSRYSYHEQWKGKNDEYELEELEPDIEPDTKPAIEHDGWQTVERKIKVKRDKVQEAIDNDDAPIEEEDESAWDDQLEEHETYWDERKRN